MFGYFFVALVVVVGVVVLVVACAALAALAVAAPPVVAVVVSPLRPELRITFPAVGLKSFLRSASVVAVVAVVLFAALLTLTVDAVVLPPAFMIVAKVPLGNCVVSEDFCALVARSTTDWVAVASFVGRSSNACSKLWLNCFCSSSVNVLP